MAQTTVKLASGPSMPLVGFDLWGASRECSRYRLQCQAHDDSSTSLESTANAGQAIKAGYRLFDGAYDYANEKEAGQGIKRAIDEGLGKREDIFVTTKLWNDFHRKEHALHMANAQNEAWGLAYIDLYLIHFPVALKYVDPQDIRYPGWWMDKDHKEISLDKVPLQETWQALEEIADSGIAKSIGISNAPAQLLYDISSYARHPISSLQIEHHPYLVQPELIELVKDLNIIVTAYSSFGPQSFLKLPPAFRERAQDTPLLWDVDPVKKAAERTGKTPAQVLLRWATQRGIAVIPKSNNVDRLQQNLRVVDFDLTEGEIEVIAELDKELDVQ